MENDIDKRNEPRFFAGGTVRFRIVDESESSKISGFCTARVVNISTTGIAIMSTGQFQEGAVAEIDLSVDRRGARPFQPVHAFCKVQWSREIKEGIYETGMDFIVIKQKDLRILNKCVPFNGLSATEVKQ